MRILVIQTAFIGDVILATSLIESISAAHKSAQIDVVVRKGNEILMKNNPHVNRVYIWNKQKRKYYHLLKLIKEVRQTHYDHLLCLQRFGAMGFLSMRAKAKVKSGFKKNPFSFTFHHKLDHNVNNGIHEVERNLQLAKHIGDIEVSKPALYPSEDDMAKVKQYQTEPYVVIAPNSVWFTKQAPEEFWIKLIVQQKQFVYLIGAPNDRDRCQEIISKSDKSNITNLCGELSLMESTALIKGASKVFSCDSAPMHIASATNTPTTAVYCSTIPEFGFGPLADDSTIIQISEELECRPCGLHGFKSCPKSHFKCGKALSNEI